MYNLLQKNDIYSNHKESFVNYALLYVMVIWLKQQTFEVLCLNEGLEIDPRPQIIPKN